MAATRLALNAHAGCGIEAVAVSAAGVAEPDDPEAPEVEPEGVTLAEDSAEELSSSDGPQPVRTTRPKNAAATAKPRASR